MGKFLFLWWWWREVLLLLFYEAKAFLVYEHWMFLCVCIYGKRKKNIGIFLSFSFLFSVIWVWYCGKAVLKNRSGFRVTCLSSYDWLRGLMLVNVSYRATGLWERQSVHNVFVLLAFVLVTALLLLLLKWYSHLFWWRHFFSFC
jgi:hypothetical protein